MKSIEAWEQQIAEGYCMTYDEALDFAAHTPDAQLEELAHRLRTRYEGNRIEMCSIINARSGRCSEDCKWCSQSRHHHTQIDIYPLIDAEPALREAAHNAAKGVHRFSLVTSGRTLSEEETQCVGAIYARLRAEVPIARCASLGLLNKEQLQHLYESGVQRYHCNMESAPSHFPKLCTTHTLAEKLRTIAWAREVGMEICCGGIIGMGESEAQRIEFAIALRQTGAVSIPLNILNPIPGTPLEHTAPLTDREVLRTAALMRILNPKAAIRLAGGRTLIRSIVPQLLHSGVSALIVGDMLTTSGSDIDTDKALFRAEGFQV